MADYFCPGCGWHPCKCWRALDRQRIATTEVRRLTWVCDHLPRKTHPEKAHTPAVANQWWFGHRSIRPQT